MLAFIWAEDEQGAIGKDNALPWSLPADMRFFKETTMGHTVIMGRKTFESMGGRPLPKRRNIVMTRQSEYQAEGVEVVHTPAEVMELLDPAEQAFVIGGSEIFALMYPYADVLLQTKISGDFSGTTFMSPINWEEWELVEEKAGVLDEKNHYEHVFRQYRRKHKS